MVWGVTTVVVKDDVWYSMAAGHSCGASHRALNALCSVGSWTAWSSFFLASKCVQRFWSHPLCSAPVLPLVPDIRLSLPWQKCCNPWGGRGPGSQGTGGLHPALSGGESPPVGPALLGAAWLGPGRAHLRARPRVLPWPEDRATAKHGASCSWVPKR